MDKSGRLERLARELLSHPGGGELAQLLINEGEQFISGFGITVVNTIEDLRYIAQRDPLYERNRNNWKMQMVPAFAERTETLGLWNCGGSFEGSSFATLTAEEADGGDVR